MKLGIIMEMESEGGPLLGTKNPFAKTPSASKPKSVANSTGNSSVKKRSLACVRQQEYKNACRCNLKGFKVKQSVCAKNWRGRGCQWTGGYCLSKKRLSVKKAANISGTSTSGALGSAAPPLEPMMGAEERALQPLQLKPSATKKTSSSSAKSRVKDKLVGGLGEAAPGVWALSVAPKAKAKKLCKFDSEFFLPTYNFGYEGGTPGVEKCCDDTKKANAACTMKCVIKKRAGNHECVGKVVGTMTAFTKPDAKLCFKGNMKWATGKTETIDIKFHEDDFFTVNFKKTGGNPWKAQFQN